MAEVAKSQPVKVREYNRFKITPIAGALGAEIHGIDVNNLDDETFDDIHSAWLQYQVLAIRDQDVTPDQQKEFGRRCPSLGKCHRRPWVRPLGIQDYRLLQCNND